MKNIDSIEPRCKAPLKFTSDVYLFNYEDLIDLKKYLDNEPMPKRVFLCDIVNDLKKEGYDKCLKKRKKELKEMEKNIKKEFKQINQLKS